MSASVVAIYISPAQKKALEVCGAPVYVEDSETGEEFLVDSSGRRYLMTLTRYGLHESAAYYLAPSGTRYNWKGVLDILLSMEVRGRSNPHEKIGEEKQLSEFFEFAFAPPRVGIDFIYVRDIDTDPKPKINSAEVYPTSSGGYVALHNTRRGRNTVTFCDDI